MLADKLRGQIARLRALPADELRLVSAARGIDNFEAFVEWSEKGIAFVEFAAAGGPDPEADAVTQGQEAVAILDAQRPVAQLRVEATLARKVATKLKRPADTAAVDALVDTWLSVSAIRSPSSVEKKRRCLAFFVQVVGVVEPRDITREHAMKFRDAVEARTDLKSSTKSAYLYDLHRLLECALSKGQVDFNAAHGIKVSKPKAKYVDNDDDKKPFEPHHVRAIFKALPALNTDFQWMVKLMAYHGFRSKELAQLQVDDIAASFGVPIIRVHDRHGSVKNRPSMRDVPIHPKCRGIVDYAKAAEGPWLFGSLPTTWKQGREGKFQQAAGKFLRSVVKITDPDLTMHCLRHTWRTLAREMDMPEAISTAIMGHSRGKGDHAKYGRVPSLELRAKWLKRIDPVV